MRSYLFILFSKLQSNIFIIYFLAQVFPTLSLLRFLRWSPVFFQHASIFLKHFVTFYQKMLQAHLIFQFIYFSTSVYAIVILCFLLLFLGNFSFFKEYCHFTFYLSHYSYVVVSYHPHFLDN